MHQPLTGCAFGRRRALSGRGRQVHHQASDTASPGERRLAVGQIMIVQTAVAEAEQEIWQNPHE